MSDRLERDKFLTPEEYGKFMAAAEALHVPKRDYGARPDRTARARRLMYLGLTAVGFGTGARERELVGLRIADVLFDWTRDLSAEDAPLALIRIRRAKRRDRRTGGPVYHEVALPPRARAALVGYLRALPDERLEPHARIFPVTTRQVRRIFKDVCRRAGLNPRYSAHAMRHYRGLRLFEQTGDMKFVAANLGHADLKSTQVYVHTLHGNQKAASIE